MYKLFRSLRWRIQSWHALILIVVVVGFGSMLQWETVRGHWDRVDEELLGAARILEGSMMAVPPTILEAMAKDITMRGPTFRPPPRNRPRRPFDNELPPIGDPRIAPSDSPRNWKFPTNSEEPTPDLTQEEWEATIELPSQLPAQLGRDEGPAYFVIWRNDGTVLKQSSTPLQTPTFGIDVLQRVERDRYVRQQRGPFREVFIRGPRETLICVGRPAQIEQDRVNHLTRNIVLSGLSALAIGLIGGWWMSKRAIEPIERMSKTALGITATHLNERIELNGFDTELAGLGRSLNTMLDRLNRAFDQQLQFTADASHELRTPVAVLLTSSELALSKLRTADEYREQLLKCQRAANRMRELTDSLLMLARLDTNSRMETTQVNLKELIEESVEQIQPLADPRSVKIESQLAPISIVANRAMLRLAVDNLISNAIKYNREQGSVFVRLARCEGKAVIEVQDEGIGIPQSAIPRLFDRFYRVDASRSRSEGGTGLGLAIAQRIVECHRGTIGVVSELDHGSTFRIELPES